MHPEVLDAMREIERRDLAVLRANGSALLMRPVYEDLGELKNDQAPKSAARKLLNLTI